jgi:hydrogenase-4 membrane subunit HyfE
VNDPAAQALASIMLLCAFALLTLIRPAALIAIYRTQAIALAAAACWQGHTQHAGGLYATALIVLALHGFLLPRLLNGATQAIQPKPLLPPVFAAAFGIGLLGLAIFLIPASGSALAIPLAVLLLGLLVMLIRRDVFKRTIGVLSIGNALLLTAVTLPSLPFVPAFAAALGALAALPFLLAPHLYGQEAG